MADLVTTLQVESKALETLIWKVNQIMAINQHQNRKALQLQNQSRPHSPSNSVSSKNINNQFMHNQFLEVDDQNMTNGERVHKRQRIVSDSGALSQSNYQLQHQNNPANNYGGTLNNEQSAKSNQSMNSQQIFQDNPQSKQMTNLPLPQLHHLQFYKRKIEEKHVLINQIITQIAEQMKASAQVSVLENQINAKEKKMADTKAVLAQAFNMLPQPEAEPKPVNLSVSYLLDAGTKLKLSQPPVNTFTSILHNPFETDSDRSLSDPLIEPKDLIVGFDQEIKFSSQLVNGETLPSDKRIYLKFTVNSPMIPTQYSGHFYDNPIKLSKENIEEMCKGQQDGQFKIEFKVVATLEGKMPSRVSIHQYEVRAGVPVKNNAADMVEQAEFERKADMIPKDLEGIEGMGDSMRQSKRIEEELSSSVVKSMRSEFSGFGDDY